MTKQNEKRILLGVEHMFFNEKSQQEIDLQELCHFSDKQMRQVKNEVYEISKKTNKHENTVMEHIINIALEVMPRDMQPERFKNYKKYGY
jgi:hypothetical protein